jgi:hypothetical protein
MFSIKNQTDILTGYKLQIRNFSNDESITGIRQQELPQPVSWLHAWLSLCQSNQAVTQKGG